ncbi:hypothetical protein CRYUN_Cryun18bG0100000 [Craigia yunnanensis]
MDSNIEEIAHEFLASFSMFRVYKDGRIESLRQTKMVPPSNDPQTGVQSKDTSPDSCLPTRLFLPKITNPSTKIPLVIYIHGGAFCIESHFSPTYHNYLTSLVNKANVIAIFVQYRKAPEHLLPIAYDDAWAAIKWDGPEPWINDHADFERVFFAGDSAGAKIAHNMTMKAGVDGLIGVKIVGMLLLNSFFMNNELDELIEFIFPSSDVVDDPRMKPASAIKELAGLACSRVLVCVSKKDFLRDRGLAYYEAIQKSGWDGVIDIFETPGEGHVFHLSSPSCQ